GVSRGGRALIEGLVDGLNKTERVAGFLNAASTMTGINLEAVRRAAELAQIDFPLDKKCGEGGSELSEGQRQRVLLARAFLRRPRVLVLDEVTSGLDVERERAVLEAARRVAEAVVVISHRPTPGEFANKVVEVRDGVARAGV
ncbi:MAG: ATP-binding cassette domain-containing protein, partial [Pyrobaculum sp.]